MSWSHPDQFAATVRIVEEVAGRPLMDDAAMVHHIDAVADFQRSQRVLLDDQRRDAFRLQKAHGLHHVLHDAWRQPLRSEEHTSELQSRENLVCRLLLEKVTRRFLISTPLPYTTLFRSSRRSRADPSWTMRPWSIT